AAATLDRAQPPGTDLLVDRTAAHRQYGHGLRHPVEHPAGRRPTAGLRHVHIGSPSIESVGSGCADALIVVAGSCGGGEGEFSGGGGGVPGAVVSPAFDNEDRSLIERTAPRVAFAAGMMLAPAMFGAGAAQLAEGDGVAAGFGEEVAAVA